MRSIKLIFLIALGILILFIIVLLFLFVGPSTQKIIEKAINEKNISYCSELKDKADQNICLFNLSDYTSEACDYMQDVRYWETRNAHNVEGLQLECYKKLFDKNPSEEICEKMETNLKNDERYSIWSIKECFEEFGYSSVELCNKLKTDYIDYWSCFVNWLHIPLELNETQCIDFAKFSEDNRWRCYEDLAELEKNEEFCDEMFLPNSTVYADPTLIDACLRNAAIAKKDTALCDKLPTDCYNCENPPMYTCQKDISSEMNCTSVRDSCIDGIQSSS